MLVFGLDCFFKNKEKEKVRESGFIGEKISNQLKS
jgi:hypothetical protein